jgi:ketosteroid isomerase-like protein
MSQENLEIVRREYAAFAARDWGALADLCHHDIEYETLDSAPGVAGSYRGLDEITAFFDAWFSPYSEFRVEPDEIVDAGDQVVTVERHAARGLQGAEGGSWLHHTFACVISFKDGKIWRVKESPSRAEALQAAGLSE